jgi:hypothetical protein
MQRLFALLRRDLGAVRAGLTPRGGDTPDGPNVVVLGLPRGQALWARLAAPPADSAVVRARMEMLADSFSQLLEREGERRPPPRRASSASLRRALRDLATAAGARDAFVLDTRSPMLWGSASGLSGPLLGSPVLRVVQPGDANVQNRRDKRLAWLRKAVAEVRQIPRIHDLPRGAHLRMASSDAELGFLVRSFAAIYLLVLAYDTPFEELHAEREASRALPTIESLVLALPSPDPLDGSTPSAMARRRP